MITLVVIGRCGNDDDDNYDDDNNDDDGKDDNDDDDEDDYDDDDGDDDDDYHDNKTFIWFNFCTTMNQNNYFNINSNNTEN